MPKLRIPTRVKTSRLRKAPTVSPRGEVWFGAYEVIRRLDGPGPGELWLVRHLRRGGLFAARVLPRRDLEAAVRSELPAAAHRLMCVRHAAVERCWEVRRGEGGRIVLFLELCEGTLLEERLAEGPLAAEEVAALAVRLAGGLAVAHSRGLTHGQVTPRSIMLPYGRLERAKWIDFAVDGGAPVGEEAAFCAEPERLVYASPEQLGFHSGHVDARTDHYSLGLVLCQAALGAPVDMGTDFRQALEARRALTEMPSEVPEVLRPLLEPLLAFAPDARPDLAAVAQTNPLKATAEGDGFWSRWNRN